MKMNFMHRSEFKIKDLFSLNDLYYFIKTQSEI